MSWMPYGLMSLWSAFTGSLEWHSVVTSLPVMFAKTSAIWNPIVFICNDRSLRRFTLKLICGCRVTTMEPLSESSSRNSRRNNNNMDNGPPRQEPPASYQMRPAAFALKLMPRLGEKHVGKTVAGTEVVHLGSAGPSHCARKDVCTKTHGSTV